MCGKKSRSVREENPDLEERYSGLPARQTAEKPEQNYIFRLKIYILSLKMCISKLKIYILRLETEHDGGIRKLVPPENNSYLPPPFFFPV